MSNDGTVYKQYKHGGREDSSKVFTASNKFK